MQATGGGAAASDGLDHLRRTTPDLALAELLHDEAGGFERGDSRRVSLPVDQGCVVAVGLDLDDEREDDVAIVDPAGPRGAAGVDLPTERLDAAVFEDGLEPRLEPAGRWDVVVTAALEQVAASEPCPDDLVRGRRRAHVGPSDPTADASTSGVEGPLRPLSGGRSGTAAAP